MSRKRSAARLLLDTSAVIHQLHGHTLHQAAARGALGNAELLVPVFVRMEYLRGVILNLIECGVSSASRSPCRMPSSTGRRRCGRSGS